MSFIRNALKGYEPVLVTALVRLAVYALAAWGGITIEPDLADEIALALGGVAAADLLTSLFARSKVTPDKKASDLPPSARG